MPRLTRPSLGGRRRVATGPRPATVRSGWRTGVQLVVVLVAVAAVAAGCGSASSASPAYQAWVTNGAYQSYPLHTVVQVDLATGTRGLRVDTGSEPAGIAAADHGSRLVVVNRGSDTLRLVDTASGALLGSVRVGLEPDAVAVVPAPGRGPETALVANFAGDSVTPVDLATMRAGPAIPVGREPTAIAVTPGAVVVPGGTGGRGEAVVTNFAGDSVTPVDLATMRTGPAIPVGSEPEAVAIAPHGAGGEPGPAAVVADYGDDTLTPVGITPGTAGAPLTVPVAPTGLAVAPDGTIWVSGGSTLYPVTSGFGIGTPIHFRAPTEAVALSADSTTAWVAEQDGAVTSASLPAGPVGRTIQVHGEPSSIVVLGSP